MVCVSIEVGVTIYLTSGNLPFVQEHCDQTMSYFQQNLVPVRLTA